MGQEIDVLKARQEANSNPTGFIPLEEQQSKQALVRVCCPIYLLERTAALQPWMDRRLLLMPCVYPKTSGSTKL